MLRTSGFVREPVSGAARRSPRVALVQLIAAAALALSTLVAVTAVSIGMARADGPAAIAFLLGL
jgi:hypothetical protein